MVERRPGGRSARVRHAVLDAAVALLADAGWSAFSIDAVAAAAGVHRTSLYRRWGTREALALDAVSEHARDRIPVPDTGALASDLRELAWAVAAEISSPVGRALLRVDVMGGAGLDDLRQEAFLQRYRQVGRIIDRAVARGEAPSGTDPVGVARTLSAPLLVRLLVTGEPLDRAAVEQAAAAATAATVAGVFTTAAV